MFRAIFWMAVGAALLYFYQDPELFVQLINNIKN